MRLAPKVFDLAREYRILSRLAGVIGPDLRAAERARIVFLLPRCDTISRAEMRKAWPLRRPSVQWLYGYKNSYTKN